MPNGEAQPELKRDKDWYGWEWHKASCAKDI